MVRRALTPSADRWASAPIPTPATPRRERVPRPEQVQEEARLHDAVARRQDAERSGVEELHAMEAMEFNAAWSKNMEDFERQAEDIVNETKHRHAQDFEKYQAEIREKTPMRYACPAWCWERLPSHSSPTQSHGCPSRAGKNSPASCST